MLNFVNVMGRLTADPVLRRTQGDVAVCSFDVAVERDIKTNGEKETDFFHVVAWRNTAEFVDKYMGKGSMAVVAGRLQNRSWTTDNGDKRTVTEIVANNVYFGESKTQNPKSPSFMDVDMPDDDLPF